MNLAYINKTLHTPQQQHSSPNKARTKLPIPIKKRNLLFVLLIDNGGCSLKQIKTNSPLKKKKETSFKYTQHPTNSQSPLKKVTSLWSDPIQIKSIQNPELPLPVRHGSNRFKRLHQPTLRIPVTILPPPQRIRQEIPRGAVGLRDDGGERAIGEERVRRAADTVRIGVGGLVREGAPLWGLVDGVRLQNQPALGAEGVPGGVVHHQLRLLLAIRTIRVRHRNLIWS